MNTLVNYLTPYPIQASATLLTESGICDLSEDFSLFFRRLITLTCSDSANLKFSASLPALTCDFSQQFPGHSLENKIKRGR